MANQSDPTGCLILVGIAGSISAAIWAWSRIQKKINDRAIQIGYQLFTSKQAELTRIIEEKERISVSELSQRADLLMQERQYIDSAREAFLKGILPGRRWLARFIAEADKASDEMRASRLATKSHPALKAAEEVALARAERRTLNERAKFLEYQLRSFKEYFPFLEEYEEVLLDEAVPIHQGEVNMTELEKVDPVLIYVQKHEYENLSPSERSQLALDRYLSRTLSKAAIGRFYERYLGYLYEKDGWKVEYKGIIEGFEDLGRDLICRKGRETVIVQAKCWSSEKLIHEKHIFQLFGTTQLYRLDMPTEGHGEADVSAVFITTTNLSPVAKKAAEWLKIEVKERFAIDKAYPMIKCNINQASREKIYHLPFDQQYDRTKIDPGLGEFYAATVAEAESKGFRRAMRYFGA